MIYDVKMRLDGTSIYIETGLRDALVGELSRKVMDTEDQLIRTGLIELGWTPPGVPPAGGEQADCEALAIMHRQAQVRWCAERDALKAEVEQLHGLHQIEQKRAGANAVRANELQSELTKARELLNRLTAYGRVGFDLNDADAARVDTYDFLAHQSAPAARHQHHCLMLDPEEPEIRCTCGAVNS